MFNILTQRFPVSVEIDGEKCYLNTDFKRWITFEIIMSNPFFKEEEKLAIILPLCLKKLPSSLEVAIKACRRFYSGESEKTFINTEIPDKPVYSFHYDSELIYSAFMTQYKIDLACTSMHWYKFRALFKGLGSENKICEIMHYRGMDLSEIKDSALKEKYRRLKKLWALPDIRGEKEKEDEFARAVEAL